VNVYDFDHTVYDGDSSVDFYRFVLCCRPHLIVLLPFQVWGMILFYISIYSKERMKEIFFVFIRYIPMQKMVSRFWERNRRKIKTWYLQQKLDSDVIISASPEFLLEPVVCGFLGVALIASRIDTCTGKYIGKNCFGEEKVIRLFAMYPDGVIENFYSDNHADTPLAHMAKNAFCVQKNYFTRWNNA